MKIHSYAYEGSVDHHSIGFCVECAKSGEQVGVMSYGFLMPEDPLIYTILDKIEHTYLIEILKKYRITENIIQDCIIQLFPDRSYKVNLNLPLTVNIISKKESVSKNQPIYEEDVADIVGVNFGGLKISNDCGLIFIYRYKWRTYLLFDFLPLLPGDKKREFSENMLHRDTNALLTNVVRHSVFRECMDVKETTKQALYDKGWFPMYES